MPEIEYGDPERDNLRASANEFSTLKEMAAWKDIKDHLREVKQEHVKRLSREGVNQRDADFSRGAIAICNDLIGTEGQSLVDMLRDLAEQIEEQQNGRNRRANR